MSEPTDANSAPALGPLSVRPRVDPDDIALDIVDTFGREIGVLWEIDQDGDPIDQQEAYARLFAASPLLLRIVQAMDLEVECFWCEMAGRHNHTDGCLVAEALRIVKGERA